MRAIIIDKLKWGAFVSAKQSFSVGDDIIIATFSDKKIKDKKMAQVKRVTDEGIEIRYDKADFSLILAQGF